ncbi:hypothetical protein CASFOL_006803 [Castilleja foliolosa]|uniref:F-box domain-containing protein n=1 Tax=Castilleja foliolosa TaxID=1961234 RepID=A0ABD3E7E5_9LAMI
MAKLFKAEKPSSAQIVASIDDLLIEIIKRLPMKKIVQFKLVSKHWDSIIMDTKLCLLQNQLSAVGLIFEAYKALDSYIIFLDKSISPLVRNMTRINDTWYQHCKIIHSCNGLLLCVSNPAPNLSQRYYVCNPTTKKYITLPKVVFDHGRVSIRGMYLAFDPSKSPHYKVVCLLRSSRDWLHLFDVYSSETRSWKKGTKLFSANVRFDIEDGVYWSGAIHWVNVVTKPREFIYFSLDCDQTPKKFPKPPLQDDKEYNRSSYYFGESCDHLHFVDAHRELDEFIVYEMKRDYSEWFVKFIVSVPEIQRDYSEWDYSEWLVKHKANNENSYESFYKYKVSVQVDTVVRGENDEDSFLVIETSRRIARYNLKQKSCETLCDIKSVVGDRWVYWGSKCPFQYIKSICSV